MTVKSSESTDEELLVSEEPVIEVEDSDEELVLDNLETRLKTEAIIKEISDDRRRIWEVIAENSSMEELLDLSGKNIPDEDTAVVGSLTIERRKYFDEVRRNRMENPKKRRLDKEDMK